MGIGVFSSSSFLCLCCDFSFVCVVTGNEMAWASLVEFCEMLTSDYKMDGGWAWGYGVGWRLCWWWWISMGVMLKSNITHDFHDQQMCVSLDCDCGCLWYVDDAVRRMMGSVRSKNLGAVKCCIVRD